LIATTSGNQFAYVANAQADYVSATDLRGGKVMARIRVGQGPAQKSSSGPVTVEKKSAASEHFIGDTIMTSQIRTERGHSFRAERTDDAVVLRFPSLNRLLRAFLPDEAVKHVQAARREQLLALRAVLDAAITRIESAAQEHDRRDVRRTELRIE
jgi:hypothetical protein